MSCIERFSSLLVVPSEFSVLSSKDKLDFLIHSMQKIVEIDRVRFFRERFATPEQFKEEYPEDYNVAMATVWHSLKKAYIDYFQDIDDAALKLNEKDVHRKQLFEILKQFGTEDIEDTLFGEDEDA